MPDVKIIADLRECEQSRVAVLEDGKLAEIFIEYNYGDNQNLLSQNTNSSKLITQGDIFKARVEALVPAISAAFLKLSPKSQAGQKIPSGSGNSFMYINEAKDPSAIKPGHELIVQVIRNARKNKAPRVSPKISIPGRWLVLVPESNDTGVSKRISDMAERKRLKSIADEIKADFPDFGIIVRTAAEGISREHLRSDVNTLIELWRDIQEKAESLSAPCLLYRDTGTLGRVLRDEVSGKIDEIIVDEPIEYERAKEFTERFYPEKPSIKLYDGITPVFEYFGIEDEIRKALERKVWLKSGAYLVIDQTEALTVIDVNTGKFTNSPDMRHTTLSTNLEAADEIARQLRLRSIGGIVVVDFIDMNFENDKHTLLNHFESVLSHDRLKAKVFSITQLGLVELTRKRERPDLKSILTRNCPVCIDNGFVEREENIAMSIKRFIRKITSSNNAQAFLIQTSPYAASYIYNYLDDWENEFGRKFLIASMNDFHWSKYRLEYQGDIESTEKRAKELKLENKGQVIIYGTL